MKNDKKESKTLSFVLSHRKSMTLICIIIYIISTVLLCYFSPNPNNEPTFSLDRIEKAAGIISFLFIVISAVIAVWQYYISCRNEHIKNETERIQKSIDLIEYYKDNILDKGVAIINIFRTAKISEILGKINNAKMREFNNYELHQLLSDDDISKLKEIEQSDSFITAIFIANESFNLNIPGITYCDDSTIKIKNAQKVLNAFMEHYLTKTLNNLEYFAMHFTHNLAEENVIYQSAHQTFIEIVESTYYHISSQNSSDSCCKYYTNLISLYNNWKSKQTENTRNMMDCQRNFIEQGPKAKKIDM